MVDQEVNELLIASNTGEGKLYQKYYPGLLGATMIITSRLMLTGRRATRIFITNNVPINSKIVNQAHNILLSSDNAFDNRPIHLKLDYELVRSMQKEGMEL